jgi:hypothetical protein
MAGHEGTLRLLPNNLLIMPCNPNNFNNLVSLYSELN